MNGAASGDDMEGDAISITETVAAVRTEHLTAHAPEWPQSFSSFVCFSQGWDWWQQSACNAWCGGLTGIVSGAINPATMDARISAADTGKTVSDAATTATKMACKAFIILPNIGLWQSGQVNSL